MKTVATLASVAILQLAASGLALAEPKDDLKAKIDASNICKPLKFDIIDVAKIVGLSLPTIPVDTKVGFDKGSHVVRTLNVKEKKLNSDIELGCQPSNEGAVFKVPGMPSPEKFRLTDNVSCAGTINQDGSVPDLLCKNSGEVGKLLSAITDLNGQMKPLFQAVLQSHSISGGR